MNEFRSFLHLPCFFLSQDSCTFGKPRRFDRTSAGKMMELIAMQKWSIGEVALWGKCREITDYMFEVQYYLSQSQAMC